MELIACTIGMQEGLDVITRKGSVLQCHKDMAEMVTLSEIGMSKAILEAGYNLDCLMLRYQVSGHLVGVFMK